MYEFILVVFIITAIVLITVIIFQQGQHSDMGNSIKTGVSGTLFGASGSNNFMIRIISILATLFFITALVLSNISVNRSDKINKQDNANATPKTEIKNRSTTLFKSTKK